MRTDIQSNTFLLLSWYYFENGYGCCIWIQENITENITVDGYGSLSFEDYYLMGIKKCRKIGVWSS